MQLQLSASVVHRLMICRDGAQLSQDCLVQEHCRGHPASPGGCVTAVRVPSPHWNILLLLLRDCQVDRLALLHPGKPPLSSGESSHSIPYAALMDDRLGG